MGTCNFQTQKHFDDYAVFFEPLSEEEVQKQYEQDTECSYDEEFEEQVFWEDLDRNFKSLLPTVEKKFKLNFFTFELESGYYDGCQILVKSNISYLDVDDLTDMDFSDWDNDDMRYYFGHIADCKSKILRKLRAEIKRIDKKVLPYIAKELGFRKFTRLGVFNNGEGVYEWAA